MARARVLLLGDDLRRSFQGRLAALLSEDGLEVVGPDRSCGNAAGLAEGVEGWVEAFEPDMACFGCGPWASEELAAAVASRDGLDLLAPMNLGDFERGLMRTVEMLQRWCGRQVVYYTTPPVHADRVSRAADDPDLGHRLNDWIAQYNQQAAALLGELNVGTADLYHELARHDDDGLAADGLALSPAGIEIAAGVVATGIYGIVHP